MFYMTPKIYIYQDTMNKLFFVFVKIKATL